MRRFYQAASAGPVEAGGFAVLLDGKPLPTPARRPLVLPSEPLARAIAAEWHGQGETIQPQAMPLTRIAATAIDRINDNPEPAIAEMVNYGGTDLLCYRAERPADLVALQAELWQPLLDWLLHRFDIHLATTDAMRAIPQSPAAMAALRKVIASREALELSALHAVTTGTGSVVIGLAVAEGQIDAEAAIAASQLDELYQSRLWGQDAEAEARRAAMAVELREGERFLRLLAGAGD